ncbi:MAG: hypothetical protein JJU11_09790 [Candidatus Sumerlaeia bacterium]|nr:hypothetical protein [Candidatus Sumerlaeia bacterium]
MGCSLRLPDSHGGRSGITQLMEAQALDTAVRRVQWRQDLSDHKLYLGVAAAPKESINQEYLRLAVKNAMAQQRVHPEFVENENDANLQLYVMVDSLGTDTYLMRNDNLVTWLLSGPLSLIYSVDVNQTSVAMIRANLYDVDAGATVETARVMETTYFRRARFILGLLPFTFTNLRETP